MTATAIASMLADRAEQTAAFLLPGGTKHGREWLAGSTAGEAGSSLKVVIDGSKQGMWCDFATDEKGDLIGLWQKARSLTLPEACREALDWMEVPESVRQDKSHHRTQPKQEKTKVPDQRWIELQQVMRPGSLPDLRALSDLRRVSIAALELATRHGQLFFAPVHDSGERHPAWILTDSSRRHAQARKMDGSLWHFGGSHKPAKSKTIWGTDSRWPVGLAEATTTQLYLVEGAPDFLAAWHFIWAKGLTNSVRPVAMFGASTKIGADALPLFSGKTVRIFPHADDAGGKGAARWATQLTDSLTKLYDFKKHGVKDLNELIEVSRAAEEDPQ